MKTSIYISAEEIQAIAYSGDKIQHFATHNIPEGTMFNGTIMDSALLSECLVAMKKNNPQLFQKETTLVVDGSSVLTRRIVSPKLNKKQYLQLVRDEFVDSIGDIEDLVTGYRKLEVAENAILGCAVNKVMVDRYLATFEEAGIKLSSIHIGVELLLSFVKSKPEIHEQNFVLNVVDGMTMLSMVFVKGDNIFMQRTRLYGEDKEQIYASILGSLSGLIQFVQSQQHDPLTHSYYLGVSSAGVALLQERNTYEGIRMGTFALSKDTANMPPWAHFACLNVQYGGKGIDFLRARKDLDAFIKSKKPKKYWIPAVIVYVLAAAGVSGYLWWELRGVTQEIEEVNAFLENPDTVERLDNITTMMDDTALYNRRINQVDERLAWVASMPPAASGMMDFILVNHGIEVTVLNFDFSEIPGAVRVNAITPDERIATDFVNALYDSGIAESVHYQGFGTGGDGVFTFSLDITLYVEEIIEEVEDEEGGDE
ncbi:MAG: hypothetical protein FWC67_01185 [Defluviitaleaceae bacterium]|nr:hypothetical protein [Defluviitaleaceae bacterium]